MTTEAVAPTTNPATHAQQELARFVEPTSGLDLMTLSTVMVQSGFFPDLRSVAQGAVKILAGRELGFPPIASLRHIYVHKGHIGLQATLIASRIRKSGRYDYKILRADDQGAEIEFSRKVGDEWRVEGTASFTLEEARRAELVRDGSGYDHYPPDMFFARAMTRGQRRFCPDLFEQTVYSQEEIAEIAGREIPDAGSRPEGLPAEATLMPRRKGEAPPEPIQPDDDYGTPVSDEDALAATAGVAEVLTGPAPDGVVPAIVAQQAPAQDDGPVDEELTREMWLDKIDRLVADRKIKAPIFARQWEKYVGGDRDAARIDKLQTLYDVLVKITGPAQESLPQPPAKPVSFLIGPKTYHTAGITKDQLIAAFNLSDQVNKKAGSDLAKAMLLKEFKVKSRTDLTADDANKYLVRLREVLEG